MKKTLFLTVLAALMSFAASAQRYCNPLPMPVGDGGTAWGDVSVFFDEGKYYMYCTGGGAWVSEDMLNWEFHHVDNVPVAPDVHKYNGKYYMTGNDITIWESDSPLGPFKDMGPFKNTGGPELGWKVPFDSHLFVDDDNTPYLFWPGRGRTGIYGVELDKNDLTKFVSTPTHLFQYNPTHWYEHFGEHNEYENVCWIEGPWIIKRNGIYYCTYSCSGTQWKTYAAGYYTATSPLGPYTFGVNNPLLRKTDGVVTGPSHGSIVMGPDGNYWAFYTIVLTSPPGGRKIGMDKVVFDEHGNMSVQVTETPQPAPLAKGTVRKSVPISVGKVSRGIMPAAPAPGAAPAGRPAAPAVRPSPDVPGFYAAYAVDDYTGTMWKPDPSEKEPCILLDLSAADGVNVIDLFDVDGLRILFGNGERSRGGGMFSPAGGLPVYKYKLEGSIDGQNFFMLCDQTNNKKIADVTFDDFAPKQCRYVRLTVTGWPEGINLGIIEATVFGKYSGYLPPKNPQENDRYLFNY